MNNAQMNLQLPQVRQRISQEARSTMKLRGVGEQEDELMHIDPTV
jgi:hypothetical protein